MPRSALQLPELWLMRGRFPAGVWRPSPGPPLPTRSRLADSGGSGEPAAAGNHESSPWDPCAFLSYNTRMLFSKVHVPFVNLVRRQEGRSHEKIVPEKEGCQTGSATAGFGLCERSGSEHARLPSVEACL